MRNKKGFTIIELIVVIAVLSLLVLLAAPKIIGYAGDAKVTQVKSDLKTYETVISGLIVKDKENVLDWDSLLPGKLILTSHGVIDKEGKITRDISDSIYLIPERIEVKSKLKGVFIWDAEKSQAFYYDPYMKLEDSNNQNNNGGQVVPYQLTSSDFVWTEFPNGYSSSEFPGKVGYYRYIGSGHSTVILPTEINGNPMSNYSFMFLQADSRINKVISGNANVTNMGAMFAGFNGSSLDLTEFDVSNVTSMETTFAMTPNLKTLNLTGWDTSNVTNMSSMFGHQSTPNTALNVIGFENLNTSNVTKMNSMFGHTRISNLDFRKWDTSKVTTATQMFYGVQMPLDLTGLDTQNIQEWNQMFYGVKLNELDLTGFDSRSALRLAQVFMNAEIGELKMGNWTNDNLLTPYGMFQGFKTDVLDLSGFAMTDDDAMYMFKDAEINTVYARNASDLDIYKRGLDNNQSINYTLKQP